MRRQLETADMMVEVEERLCDDGEHRDINADDCDKAERMSIPVILRARDRLSFLSKSELVDNY